jgi:hypothetical protein
MRCRSHHSITNIMLLFAPECDVPAIAPLALSSDFDAAARSSMTLWGAEVANATNRFTLFRIREAVGKLWRSRSLPHARAVRELRPQAPR